MSNLLWNINISPFTFLRRR